MQEIGAKAGVDLSNKSIIIADVNDEISLKHMAQRAKVRIIVESVIFVANRVVIIFISNRRLLLIVLVHIVSMVNRWSKLGTYNFSFGVVFFSV